MINNKTSRKRRRRKMTKCSYYNRQKIIIKRSLFLTTHFGTGGGRQSSQPPCSPQQPPPPLLINNGIGGAMIFWEVKHVYKRTVTSALTKQIQLTTHFSRLCSPDAVLFAFASGKQTCNPRSMREKSGGPQPDLSTGRGIN